MNFTHVTCYGTGTIGTGWGANFLLKGIKVTLYDLDDVKLAAAAEKIKSMLTFCRDSGVIDQIRMEECLGRTFYTSDRKEALKDAQFVQESCPENLELKHGVIKNIEEYCPDEAIIASSTSGLKVTDIAKIAAHPRRIIGAHPYNPVFLMPLVEIAKGELTEAQYVESAVQFYRTMGKEPIVLQKECPGFIANRLQAALNREARDLVFRGVCTVEEVDKAVVFGPGLRWGIIGPHLVFELAGGEGGLRKQAVQKGDSIKAWYEDMAKWTEIPEGYVDIACQGLLEEMANRNPGTGKTREELIHYRDEGLLMMLKFHKKL